MAHGSAEGEIRPRAETASWTAVAATVFGAAALITRDASYLFPAVMFALLRAQCGQRIVREGRFVRRIGLRPVELDLSTAQVVRGGVAWWRELFFCGRSLELRDAEGHRLYLESWLWDAETRHAFAEAAGGMRRP
jgi:hypothetical protein